MDFPIDVAPGEKNMDAVIRYRRIQWFGCALPPKADHPSGQFVISAWNCVLSHFLPTHLSISRRIHSEVDTADALHSVLTSPHHISERVAVRLSRQMCQPEHLLRMTACHGRKSIKHMVVCQGFFSVVNCSAGNHTASDFAVPDQQARQEQHTTMGNNFSVRRQDTTWRERPQRQQWWLV